MYIQPTRFCGDLLEIQLQWNRRALLLLGSLACSRQGNLGRQREWTRLENAAFTRLILAETDASRPSTPLQETQYTDHCNCKLAAAPALLGGRRRQRCIECLRCHCIGAVTLLRSAGRVHCYVPFIRPVRRGLPHNQSTGYCAQCLSSIECMMHGHR
jgi:hypothetical protein